MNVKLRDARARDQSVVEELRSAPGVRSVTRTFPDEDAADLAALLLVDVDPGEVTRVTQRFRRHPAVEYVEPAAPRSLIR